MFQKSSDWLKDSKPVGEVLQDKEKALQNFENIPDDVIGTDWTTRVKPELANCKLIYYFKIIVGVGLFIC